MDINSVNQWQHSANNSNNNSHIISESQAHRGAQSNPAIFSQNVGFSRSYTRPFQPPAHFNNSSRNHDFCTWNNAEYNRQQANCSRQWQNNNGQTFADQTQLNQQTGYNANQQVIQYNINVGNLSDPQTHVNQLVCLQKQQQQQQQHEPHSTTPLQLQHKMMNGQLYEVYNQNPVSLNTHQFVGGVRHTIADVHHGTLSTQPYFRSNNADLSLKNHPKSNQHMKPVKYGSNVCYEDNKHINLSSTKPSPVVKICERQCASHRGQRHRSLPSNQQHSTFHYRAAVPTQYQPSPYQHAAIPTQNQQLPSAYSTIATPFEQQPRQYSTIPTQSQQLPLQSPLKQQLFRELQQKQNQPRYTLQQSQQTEEISPQQNQRFSHTNQQESFINQRVSPQVPNPPPQSSPRLQQARLDSDVHSTTTRADFPRDLTLDNLIEEVENLSKPQINPKDKSQHQKKSPNNENCDDIQNASYIALQGKVDLNRCNRLTSHEAAAKTARNKTLRQSHSLDLEPQDTINTTFMRSCSTNTTKERGCDDLVLPPTVCRFLGNDVRHVRSRDYVMYLLSNDPRVAEAAIAAHLQERFKMFVCVEFPPRSPLSDGRETKKAFCLVKNAGDVSFIVNLYSCTSVRMVLVVRRMNQSAKRTVQNNRPIPELVLTTTARDKRESPIPSGYLLPSYFPDLPTELAINVQAVPNQETPPTRPSPTKEQLNNSINEIKAGQTEPQAPQNSSIVHFLGNDFSEVRSRDYVMYALSDDPRVAEAAIAAHLHESTKMFVCVEFPPRSPWSAGAREVPKSYFLVKNVRDVLRIVNFYPCTSVRTVLVVCRMSQNTEIKVQQTRSFPELDLTDEGKSPILSDLVRHIPASGPPAEQVTSVSGDAPHTSPSSSNQQTKSSARENTSQRVSQSSKVVVYSAEPPPTCPGPVNQQQSSPNPEEIKRQDSNVNVSSAEQPTTRLSPTKLPLINSIQETTVEQSEDQVHLSSSVNQTRPPSCSIESEEEKMTRIRKEVEALLNAGKPDLRKAAAKRSRGDHEPPTLDRFWRKWKSREIDVDSRSTISDVTIRDETPPTAKLQDCVQKRVLSAPAKEKAQSSSPKINDDVTSERDDVKIESVIIRVDPNDLDYDLHRYLNDNPVDVKSGLNDVIGGQDDAGADQDDVTARRDDETKRLNPEMAALNYGKSANQSKDAEIVNLRKRKRASMRAGSCRAPRLDLVYRSYLDSLQPSPIVPRQCVPRDVTIIPCSVRISDIFSLNNIA